MDAFDVPYKWRQAVEVHVFLVQMIYGVLALSTDRGLYFQVYKSNPVQMGSKFQCLVLFIILYGFKSKNIKVMNNFIIFG